MQAYRHAAGQSWNRTFTRVAALLIPVAFLLTLPVSTASAASSASSVTLTFGPAHSQPTNFWGMNIEDDNETVPNPVTALSQTPTTLLVYPAGNLTERTDYSTNTVYEVGSHKKAIVTVQDFIADCRAISCTAVMGLPMEINSPSTDAMEAKYIVDTLGFHPAFFVYGNEPAHWYCFDISWAALAAGHRCNTGNTTIPAFASETEAAIKAVTAVLGSQTPAAMCLGGSGKQGPGNETNWLRGLTANAYDRAACAAYAMHVKPAHSGTAVPTLANFYATLTGPQALPADYQNASKATDGKPLYMTEVGWATKSSVFAPVFTGTWATNVLQSALVVQAMQNLVPTMGYWAWNEGGGLHAYPRDTFWSIYTKLFPQLKHTWMASQYHGQHGIFAEATRNGAHGSSWTLMLVSTNISKSFHVSLTGSGFPLSGCGTIDIWTSSGETSRSLCDLGSGFTAPPQSVIMVTAQG
jgi:hypothetical protein